MRRSPSRAHRAPAAHAVALALAIAGPACSAGPAAQGGVGPVRSAPACETDRAVVVTDQASLASLASCASLAALTIRTGGALDTRALHALTSITGDLVIGPTVNVQEVTLSELRSVGGAIRVVANGVMQGLFLPRLEQTGRIEIDGNVALTTISLPRLTGVHGALRITDNASLELIDAPALIAIDEALVISRDPKLTMIEIDQLQRAQTVEIEAPGLAGDVLDRLRAAAAAPAAAAGPAP
jgi:hypothetical protein